MEREALLGVKKRKIEEDKEKAVELRQQSLETFAETKKRKGDSGEWRRTKQKKQKKRCYELLERKEGRRECAQKQKMKCS